MIFDSNDQNPGARFLLMAASGVIVVWGLQFAAPILRPFALALFLGILSLPIVLWLTRHRVPRPVAILVAVVVVMAVFGLLLLLASQSLPDLQSRLQRYSASLATLWDEVLARLSEWANRPVDPLITPQFLEPQRVVELVQSMVTVTATLLSQAFLVVLVMVFILAEATVFPAKLRALSHGSAQGEDRMTKVVGEVQMYLGIKTVISLVTGLIIGIFCWWMDLDFPVLLGLVAFALNYVPTVGSIIATIPALLLSLILHGSLGHLVGVAAGYLAVNTIFGNIIEPNLMGRRLGLSPLVVVLSLLFWSFVWGPLGALLSVPLTMVLKIWLENTQDLRWVAILLDNQPPTPSRSEVAVELAPPARVEVDRPVS